jgi:hypothetical protein
MVGDNALAGVQASMVYPKICQKQIQYSVSLTGEQESLDQFPGYEDHASFCAKEPGRFCSVVCNKKNN